ncbi:unnamed protein product (macronuclear) [Paramecium tetraurelia]|uniref:Uncharacterized protein n=1 Tax=Paramecium tetraurelia TaxID=5888 RepID=A0EF07_PARTE|nr:uncharacterized protein GSPATT00026221001 [Paramecium tetraurelia]CAK93898.1 unnamed protein product [Paramecium tetraurelia]|eukprot:XP_001461271.1 hypothetical protein (macronuclear) [Paramecium tetraurelia strain d4-2]
MSKQNLKATSSTLAESAYMTEMQLSQYNFSLKVANKLLQVQIEITPDSLMIQAIETAIDYFTQIYYDQDINENAETYEVFSADQKGNPLKTKFTTEQLLQEIECKSFALVTKKKGTLLSILKQPILKESTIKCNKEIPKFRYDTTINK